MLDRKGQAVNAAARRREVYHGPMSQSVTNAPKAVSSDVGRGGVVDRLVVGLIAHLTEYIIDRRRPDVSGTGETGHRLLALRL